jgi:hypothetical protein
MRVVDDIYGKNAETVRPLAEMEFRRAAASKVSIWRPFVRL